MKRTKAAKSSADRSACDPTSDYIVEELSALYTCVQRKIIPMIRRLREGLGDRSEKWTHSEMSHFFEQIVGWSRVDSASGHCLYKCVFTGKIMGFSGHDDRDLSVPSKRSILRDMQIYLNIFSNHVFKIQSWQLEVPNFSDSAVRLTEFHCNKDEILSQASVDTMRTLDMVGSKARSRNAPKP